MGRLFQLKMLNRRRSAASDGGVIVSDADSFGPLEELASVLRSGIERLESNTKLLYPHLKKKELGKLTEELSCFKGWVQGLLYGRLALNAPFLEEERFGKYYKRTIHAPLGNRDPRVINNRSHITVSWTGNKPYHQAAWHENLTNADEIEYFVQIFFKSGNTPPTEWHSTYKEFSNFAAHTAVKSWNDLPSNHYVVLVKCSVTSPTATPPPSASSLNAAHTSGDLEMYSNSLHNCLSPPVFGKWFAFPGVIRTYDKVESVNASNGQLRSILPGGSRPDWAPSDIESEPVRAVFEKSYNCSTAILTKIYPNSFDFTEVDLLRRIFEAILRWRRKLIEAIGVIMSIFTHWHSGAAAILIGFIAYWTFPFYSAFFLALINALPEIFENSGITDQPNWQKLQGLWERFKDFWSF